MPATEASPGSRTSLLAALVAVNHCHLPRQLHRCPGRVTLAPSPLLEILLMIATLAPLPIGPVAAAPRRPTPDPSPALGGSWVPGRRACRRGPGRNREPHPGCALRRAPPPRALCPPAGRILRFSHPLGSPIRRFRPMPVLQGLLAPARSWRAGLPAGPCQYRSAGFGPATGT